MSDRSRDLIEQVETYGAHNYAPLPVVLTRGAGVWLYDVEGRAYLDMLSAYSAVSFGHCHPRIVAALQAQAQRLTLTSRAFHNDQLGPLLERLAELTGLPRGLPANGGAEAVETALKAARKWGYEVKGVAPDQAEIITCENNFHGRTISIVSFSTESHYRTGFGPFTPGFKTVAFGELEALRAAITDRTVAFLVEPIQGEGGIILPPAGYLSQVEQLCKAAGVLLIVDEIQTGLGRTGSLLCCQEEGIHPDLLILGKALGGGMLPISMVMGTQEVMGVFRPGQHGSTFGGNPLACAVALVALDVLQDEQLVERSRLLGERLLTALRALRSPLIAEVRGRGLLQGIELTAQAGPARPYCEKLLQHGLLCKETHEKVIRLAPPLVINEQELDLAVSRVEAVLTAGLDL